MAWLFYIDSFKVLLKGLIVLFLQHREEFSYCFFIIVVGFFPPLER